MEHGARRGARAGAAALTARRAQVVLFVPQQEAYIVERFGKFTKILEPGLNFLVPFIDRVAYVQRSASAACRGAAAAAAAAAA